MIYSQKDITQKNLSKELDLIAKRSDCSNVNDMLYFPKYFQIETVRKCNENCIFCPKDKWDNSVPYMSDKLFEKIAEELKAYSDWITVVDLQRNGEPLLDKNLPEKVLRLKKSGIKCVNFSTNASLLSEKLAKRLLDAGLDEIMLSIDTINKEKYETMRVGLNFDKVMNNILTFFDLREKMKPDMIIRIRGVSFFDLNTPEDRNALKEWENFWEPYRKPHDRIYMKRAHNWGNQKNIDGYQKNPDVFHPCILPWSTMHIMSKGLVTICPHDYNGKMNIGDVNTNTMKEVWNDKKINNIRNLHKTGKRNDIPLCKQCVTFDLDYNMENLDIMDENKS